MDKEYYLSSLNRRQSIRERAKEIEQHAEIILKNIKSTIAVKNVGKIGIIY